MKLERPSIRAKRQGSLSTEWDSTLPSWQSYVVAGYKPPFQSRIAGNEFVHDFYKHTDWQMDCFLSNAQDSPFQIEKN